MIRVHFDNEDDGERIELDASDLTLRLDTGDLLAPVRVESPVADYELPEGVDIEAFEEALEDGNWSHHGWSEIDTGEAPAP